tara:strand:- start:1229 stop:1420 length:192 start_codon:yes stop_codon:yes gene_type:complete
MATKQQQPAVEFNIQAEIEKKVRAYNDVELRIQEIKTQLRELEVQQIKLEGVVEFLTTLRDGS